MLNISKEVHFALDKVSLGKQKRGCECLRNRKDLIKSKSREKLSWIRNFKISFMSDTKKTPNLRKAFHRMTSWMWLVGVFKEMKSVHQQDQNRIKENRPYFRFWRNHTLKFATTTANYHKSTKCTTCAATEVKDSSTVSPRKTTFI